MCRSHLGNESQDSHLSVVPTSASRVIYQKLDAGLTTYQMDLTSPDDRDIDKAMELTPKERVVLTAFDRVFDTYPDTTKLSRAHERAENRVAKLELLKEQMTYRANIRDKSYQALVRALQSIQESFEPDQRADGCDWSPPSPSTSNSGVLALLTKLRHMTKESEAAVSSAEKLKQVTLQHIEARKVASILDAALAVTEPVSTKRKRTIHPEDDIVHRVTRRLKTAIQHERDNTLREGSVLDDIYPVFPY